MLPPLPPVPDDQRVSAPMSLRFEDVAQDGRLRVLAFPPVLGPSVWLRRLAADPRVAAWRDAGIWPIMNRLVVEGTDARVSIADPIRADAAWALAHGVGPDGRVERVHMELFADVRGHEGAGWPPAPSLGPEVALGRLWAQYTFTRPFAPPGERRVTAVPGVAERPGPARDPAPAEALLSAPAGATDVDPEPADGPDVVFGVDHTDVNHHVNSLVYPHLLIDEAIRRLAPWGPVGLCRAIDVRFRRPAFAGERARLVTRRFRAADGVGVAGGVLAEDGRLYASARLRFG